MIRNGYSSRRRELETIIRDYGDDSVDLGNCFDTAERKTNVTVGLVRIFKPVISSDFDWDGFYTELDNEPQSDGIMQYNEVRAIVNSYVGAVSMFDKFEELQKQMNSYTSIIGFGRGFKFECGYDDSVTTKEDFAKKMQKASWKYLFSKMKMDRFVTSGVMQDINRFVETQSKYPFTMRNVYKMFEVIVGTREQTMNRAIEEAIDNITHRIHENRYAVEGWKTNSGHMINKKFILDWMVEPSYRSGMTLKHSSNATKVEDLMKAVCYLRGIQYDNITSLRQFFQRFDDKIQTNKWYLMGMFEFKCFKKGTMHFKFSDEKDWEVLNRAYAKIKGVTLPEKL